VKHLAATYDDFTFTGSARTVTFIHPGYSCCGNLEIRAIVYINGSPQIENWTSGSGAAYCIAQPNEKITRLVLIYSNTSPRDDIHPTKKLWPDLAVTTAACRSLSGDIHLVRTKNHNYGFGSVTDTTDFRFTAKPTFPSSAAFLASVPPTR
jgi:hypothetical protein